MNAACNIIYVCTANFSDADLPSPPVLEAVLEPGDLLYFPRGYIHQVSAWCSIVIIIIIIIKQENNEWRIVKY